MSFAAVEASAHASSVLPPGRGVLRLTRCHVSFSGRISMPPAPFAGVAGIAADSCSIELVAAPTTTIDVPAFGAEPAIDPVG